MKLKFLSQGGLRHSPWDEQDERKLFSMAKRQTPMSRVYEEFAPRSVSSINNKIVRMFLSRKGDILQVNCDD